MAWQWAMCFKLERLEIGALILLQWTKPTKDEEGKRNVDFQGFIFCYKFLQNLKYLKNYFPHTHTYFTSNVMI